VSSPTEADISRIIDDWTSETRSQWYQSPEHARAIGRLADMARTAMRERDEARAETERVRDALSAEHGQRVALGDRLAHWQHVAREMEAGWHRVDAELAAERERSRKLADAIWDEFDDGRHENDCDALHGTPECTCRFARVRAALAEYEEGEP